MLKTETDLVWRFLQVQPALSGFVLVGGSALALHLGHRRSEDLDFLWPGAQLPRRRLDIVRNKAADAVLRWESHDNPAAVEEFANGGMELTDYQQDYLAGAGVKVSFFTPEPSMLAVLDPQLEASTQGPRVASVAELFRLKALLTARRGRVRDAYDLHVLMTRCGFGMVEFHEAFVRGGMGDQAATGLVRLCNASAHALDPGYETLAPGAPGVQELARFFCEQRDTYERSQADRAWRAHRS